MNIFTDKLPASSALCLIIFITLLTSYHGVSAQDFGRFFTTYEQRLRLDELKQQGPGTQIQIDESDLFIEQDTIRHIPFL